MALAFRKKRGCVETRLRPSYPASMAAYEDAMIEYHALRENSVDFALSVNHSVNSRGASN